MSGVSGFIWIQFAIDTAVLVFGGMMSELLLVATAISYLDLEVTQPARPVKRASQAASHQPSLEESSATNSP